MRREGILTKIHMNKIKDITRPLILVGLTILFSILLFYIPKNTKIMDYKVKRVDMFMDIKPDSVINMELNDVPDIKMEIESVAQ